MNGNCKGKNRLRKLKVLVTILHYAHILRELYCLAVFVRMTDIIKVDTIQHSIEIFFNHNYIYIYIYIFIIYWLISNSNMLPSVKFLFNVLLCKFLNLQKYLPVTQMAWHLLSCCSFL